MMVAPEFSKLKALIHELICVKNNIFNQQPSKMTIEPSQWGIFCATQTEPTTPSIWKKVQHRGIEGFLKCFPMFLFFYFNEIEGVLCYTVWDPENGKKCLSVSTNKLSQNFTENSGMTKVLFGDV